MGGMGSGRSWYGYRKKTTEDYHAIDVRYWYRQGLLIPKTSFTYRWFCNERNTGSICVCTKTDRVVLSYRYPVAGDDWQEKEYPVLLDWTPNHFGGKRPWFLCPAQGCGRRVAILYGGTMFACRHCYRLAYPSQRETKYNRAERQANKIREKLGWESGVLTPIGSKPKGMHWETFIRLFMKQNELADFVVEGVIGEDPSF